MQPNWALPETLQLLAASGDAELVVEIIDLFKSDTARRLLLLREALVHKDGARVKQEAHAIKGSAIQVGADSLAVLCQRIELEAPATSCPELEPLVRQAEADFEDLCRAEAIVR
ncbi:MAG: Hpt domain-containing protein [Candidatus Sulfopaludibacter sp.]|nr:Hpt domain-containing protein [Candidatus Sulfopaludibacter sp.]